MPNFDVSINYNKVMKKFFFIFWIVFTSYVIFSANSYAYAKNNHLHSESSYQHSWCSANNGFEEYANNDFTRVDCLTKTHAVEFDFANKWAESIGQAEHYAHKTGKKGMVVLILENPEKEYVYYERVANLGKIHKFDVEYVTLKSLNAKNGLCPFKDCKCHKKK